MKKSIISLLFVTLLAPLNSLHAMEFDDSSEQVELSPQEQLMQLCAHYEPEKDAQTFASLLEQIKDINEPVKGEPYLTKACACGNIQAARMLLKKDAHPNPQHHPDNKCLSPLYHAMQNHQSFDLVDLLLSYGADANEKFEDDSYHFREKTPALLYALRLPNNSLPIMKRLLKHGANPDEKGTDLSRFSPLHVAAYWGLLPHTRLLLKHDANPTLFAGQNLPLDLARETHSQLEMKNELIKSEIQKKESTLKLIRSLEQGAIRYKQREQLITLCTQYNPEAQTENLQSLLYTLRKELDRPFCGKTYLASACEQGNVPVVRALLKAGASCNASSKEWWWNKNKTRKVCLEVQPLHLVGGNDQLACIRTLIEHGANKLEVITCPMLGTQDDEVQQMIGKTPLQIARFSAQYARKQTKDLEEQAQAASYSDEALLFEQCIKLLEPDANNKN